MKIFSILILLLICECAFADEPPCWCEFSIPSGNNQYLAKIEFNKTDSIKKPWERDWIISVYETKFDTVQIWVSKFLHDGYGGGDLSDDGQVYFYVNSWFYMNNQNQIIIYTKENIINLSLQNFGLDSSKYPHTASHQLWIKDCNLIPNLLTDTTKLEIVTLDSKKIEIALNDQKISVSNFIPATNEDNIYLKKLGWGLLVFIGIGIALLTIYKAKKA